MRLLFERVTQRLGPEPLPAGSVTTEDLLELLARLRGKGLGDGRINQYLASWRVFLGDLEERGLLLTNPAAKLRRRGGMALPRYVPTQEEMRRLLKAPDLTTEAGLRDRAILELFYGSGLRKAELLRIELRDLDLSERSLFIRLGKGGKDRAVPITEEAARAIAEYLKTRPTRAASRLFLGARLGHPLDSMSLSRTFRKLIEKADLPRRITPHCLRHACALHLLEGGADVAAVKNLLGHASIETTAIYLRLTTAHLQKVLAQSHPRG